VSTRFHTLQDAISPRHFKQHYSTFLTERVVVCACLPVFILWARVHDRIFMQFMRARWVRTLASTIGSLSRPPGLRKKVDFALGLEAK
jgi:hypothetical protein